jgi:hypothetical protein
MQVYGMWLIASYRFHPSDRFAEMRVSDVDIDLNDIDLSPQRQSTASPQIRLRISLTGSLAVGGSMQVLYGAFGIKRRRFYDASAYDTKPRLPCVHSSQRAAERR